MGPHKWLDLRRGKSDVQGQDLEESLTSPPKYPWEAHRAPLKPSSSTFPVPKPETRSAPRPPLAVPSPEAPPCPQLPPPTEPTLLPGAGRSWLLGTLNTSQASPATPPALPARQAQPSPGASLPARSPGRHPRPWLCPPPREPTALTWGLRGAGLQVTGQSAHGFHQRVAASDDVGALVALHVAHPHAHPAGLGALTGERGCGTHRRRLLSPSSRGAHRARVTRAGKGMAGSQDTGAQPHPVLPQFPCLHRRG